MAAFTPPTVYISLGANVGNRLANLRMALRLLHPLSPIEALSSLYETAPFGMTDQPPFYNAVCRVVTGLDPYGLLRLLKQIEHEIGRRPGPRWGPRPIDLDILLYGDHVLVSPELTIPHPGLAERAFVLAPLAELAPHLQHPTFGKTVSELLAAVDQSGIQRLSGPQWGVPAWNKDADTEGLEKA